MFIKTYIIIFKFLISEMIFIYIIHITPSTFADTFMMGIMQYTIMDEYNI